MWVPRSSRPHSFRRACAHTSPEGCVCGRAHVSARALLHGAHICARTLCRARTHLCVPVSVCACTHLWVPRSVCISSVCTHVSACARPSGCTCLHGRMLLLEGSPASRWRRALVSRTQSRNADGRHSSGLSRCLRAAWGGGRGSHRARGYQMVLQGQRFSPRWGVAHSGNAAWAAIRTEGGFLRGAGLGAPCSVLL